MTRQFRKGDVVSILAVVERHYSDTDDMSSIRNMVSIKPEGHTSFLVNPDQLTIMTPFFAAGDRVSKKVKPGKPPVWGTVVARDESFVWIKFDHGTHGTAMADELDLLPEKPALELVA